MKESLKSTETFLSAKLQSSVWCTVQLRGRDTLIVGLQLSRYKLGIRNMCGICGSSPGVLDRMLSKKGKNVIKLDFCMQFRNIILTNISKAQENPTGAFCKNH